MIRVPPATVKRALSAHAAIGLFAGALLYVVSFTGTLAVFHDEWQRVEQPGAPEMRTIAPAAVQRAVDRALKATNPTPASLYIQLPTADLPRATIVQNGTTVYLDASGAIAGPKQTSWADFVVALHYTLNLPGLIGLTLVGALGVMMLALSLSGVLAHPRIFRDAFRLRARDPGGIGLADWHNRLSVWTLPFTIAIALTGAVIGLGGVMSDAIARLSYDGDTAKVYQPIFGTTVAAGTAPAPLPDIAAALEDMRRRHPDLAPAYIMLNGAGTAGQRIQILATYDRRLIFGDYFNYDGRGRFRGTAGLADGALGQQAAASNYRLHFGSFGGLPVKIGYFVFGAALTAICATGCYIWLGKRRRRGFAEPRLKAAWDGVVWGTPLALALTLILRKIMGDSAPFATMFWVVSALVVGASLAAPARTTLLRPAAAAACAIAAILLAAIAA